jgi:hypothetical protein
MKKKQKLKMFEVVEHFEDFETTVVKAKSKAEALKKIQNDEDHHGEIIEVREVKK